MVISRYNLFWVLSLVVLIFMAGCGAGENALPPMENGQESTAGNNSEDGPANGETDGLGGGEDFPSEPPLTGEIILAFLRGGNIWLFTDDGVEYRLTDHGAVEKFYWSPDGEHLAYFRNHDYTRGAELWVIEIDGSGPVQLDSDTSMTGSWHPGGGQFVYGLQNVPLIRIKSVSGEQVAELPIAYPVLEGPFWHPGGELLAYTTIGADVFGLNQVYIHESSGAVRKEFPGALSPRWRPQGDSLALVVYGEQEESGYLFFRELAKVDVRGDGYTVLFNEDLAGFFPIADFSPDGSYISLSDYSHLFLVPPGGGEPRILLEQDIMTTHSEFSYHLLYTWSPAGDRLAALRYTQTGEKEWTDSWGVEGYWDLVALNPVTGDVEMVWPEVYSIDDGDAVPIRVLHPVVWHDDGESLLVLKEEEGLSNIYLVEAASGATPALYIENATQPVFR